MPSRDIVICVECGKTEQLRWIESRNAELQRRSMCFNCSFWTGHIERLDDPRCVRPPAVDGQRMHYYAEDAEHTTPGALLGFGGAWWCIRWSDGRTVETNNLWSQGQIPERWWDRLPVNADLVNKYALGLAIHRVATNIALAIIAGRTV